MISKFQINRMGVLLVALLGSAALMSLPAHCASRDVATVEVPNLGGGDALFLSPKGELIIGENRSVVAIDAKGSKRTLVADIAHLHPLASCGERGFLVHEYGQPGKLRMIDWQGRTLWKLPQVTWRVDVSPDGFICFPAPASNLFQLRPDGSINWSVPIETGHTFWSGFRIGNDNSVALALPVSKRLVLMSAEGKESWNQPTPWMHRGLILARDSKAGVVLGGTNRLAAFSSDGIKLWDVPFPPSVPAGVKLPRTNGVSPAVLKGIALDQRNFVYCQGSDDLVYVLNERGVLERAFRRSSVNSRQDEWIAFTPTGDALFSTSEYWSIGPSTNIFGRRSAELLDTDRRFVCQSPDGKTQWETALPNHFDWQLPESMKEVKYALATRSGSREMPWTRLPLVAPDGTIFLWHAISGRQKAWVHIMRGNAP
jgi:hypothetical protein